MLWFGTLAIGTRPAKGVFGLDSAKILLVLFVVEACQSTRAL
jgi:hypothetical protein